MSTLTKIFVVLMVIFSIAFTMTTINFVANTNNWKQLAQDYQLQQQVVETNMRQLAAAHAAEKTMWIDARKALDDQIAELSANTADQLTDIARLQDQLTQLESEKSSDEALARQLAAELKVAHEGWLEQREQRKGLEERNMELERRNLDLRERVNEQSAQILVLAQQQEQLEQQLNILRQEQRNVTGGTGGGAVRQAVPSESVGGVTPLTPPAATPIRGHIVEVQGKLATISVGSADGVREGMVFVIYRGSQYVGDLKVTEVEPDLAAGQIVSSRATPRPQDMVTDELAFGFAQ